MLEKSSAIVFLLPEFLVCKQAKPGCIELQASGLVGEVTVTPIE